MIWHPCYQRYGVPTDMVAKSPPSGRAESRGRTSSKVRPATGSNRSTRSERPSRLKKVLGQETGDFGAWGDSYGLSSAFFSEGSLGVTYHRRSIAPHVVERMPRARSIPNFPGYEPARDGQAFDAMMRSTVGSIPRSEASRKPSQGSRQVQSRGHQPLPMKQS
mmetsp:Transcript_44577/g.96906  ORF Transcript_44577/g.96906 Transcript_44577/m.96906 type:complete len:163 (+) Transcript_44577:72-560(+)